MQRQYENDIEIINDNYTDNIQRQKKIQVREQYVKIYQIDQYKIDNSLRFIAKLFEIMKSFATRSHAHLKVLVNLTNNLIMSEDYVHLIDHTLHVQNRFKFSQDSNIQNGQDRIQNNIKQQPNEANNIQPLKQMIDKKEQEIEKLIKAIEDGEKEKQKLQEFIEDLVDRMKQNQNQQLDNPNNIIDIQNMVKMPENNRQQMERDLFNQTGGNLYDRQRTYNDQKNFSQFYDQQDQGYFTERGIDPHKRYSSNRQSFNDLLQLQKQLYDKELENEELKNKIEDLEFDIKKVQDSQDHYKKKYQNQQDLLNDFQNQKREIEQLQEKIQELREKNNNYEQKIYKQNNKIEDIQRKLNQSNIQSQPQVNQDLNFNKSQPFENNNLQNEIDNLKGQLNDEKKKNKRLIKQIEKRSEYDIQKHLNEQQDVTDLLKCLFIQTQHIDDVLYQEQEYEYEKQLKTLEDNNSQENQEIDDQSESENFSEDNDLQDSQYFDQQEQQQINQQENIQKDQQESIHSQYSQEVQQDNQKPQIKITNPKNSDFYKSDLIKANIIQGLPKQIDSKDDNELNFQEHVNPDDIVQKIQTDEEEPLIGD